ncbi:unnamed protein product [Caenorhabditis auriculariae]|uniref:Uncharacterized protein n=1 Tax=Caenorhabditis auriculariae TaxID=2777116 RepID=A0A8S1HBQ9_9PELO|nr:unnamed protein product [Caenorhabditis auriculariae]
MGRHRRSKMLIKTTASISKATRKEIQQQGEVFENAKGSVQSSQSSKSSTNSLNSVSSRLSVSTVSVLGKDVIEYENDIQSCYPQSEGVRSLESLESLGSAAELALAQKSLEIPAPSAKVQKLTERKMPIGTPKLAVEMTDFMLCDAIDPVKPMPFAVHIQNTVRFELEQQFIWSLINDINKILEAYKRRDLELKVTYYREQKPYAKGTNSYCTEDGKKANQKPKTVKEQEELFGFSPPKEFIGKIEEKKLGCCSKIKLPLTLFWPQFSDLFSRGMRFIRW